MPEPTMPDPDLRPIDLTPSAGADRLDAGTREGLARAGQDALDACLSRFAPEERAAIWRAICRCYNRPYNPAGILAPDSTPVEIPSVPVTPAAIAASDLTGAVPEAHVIDAARIAPEAPLPDAALR
ncbi:hypothetical protein [Methylobacterium platani]|uniref:Uncharacterized protein n=2 Tax=Methylobacterium platani TaxID=427683 RepID=A0A179SHZ4_9HYPH|nr:hypothetical protein [Methylobacterium platani]KMO14350.1 hypothetical protein SQ03_19800 [Methylobacterium platani JCM 14648]OAS27185.1 hypothetical protein A5481_01775 [Methylobacterium platani]